MEAWEAGEKQRNSRKPIAMPIPQRKDSELEEFQNSTPIKSGLSPSNVLMTSAEMFTKSLSNFLSPSPHESPRQDDSRPTTEVQGRVEQQHQTHQQSHSQSQLRIRHQKTCCDEQELEFSGAFQPYRKKALKMRFNDEEA